MYDKKIILMLQRYDIFLNNWEGTYIMTTMLRFAPLIMLISCANVQSNTLEVNGKKLHNLTCSEFNSSLEECKAKASEICQENYKLLSHNKEVYPDAGDGIFYHPKHHITVQCTS